MKTSSFHRGLLLVAGLLLSLHSLVPHVHADHCLGSGEITAKEIPASENGLLSLLQALFTSSDLGEDHLEHFAADHDSVLDLDIIASLPPALSPVLAFFPYAAQPTIRRKQIFRSRHFPPSGVYPDADAPRGPPLQS